MTVSEQPVGDTYRVALDNPAANSRTHVRVEAGNRREARRRAKRDYPRHIVQCCTVASATDQEDADDE